MLAKSGRFRSKSKTLLPLRDTGAAKHNTYAGMLSTVNGTGLSRQMINDLKFSALFYEHILLFDAYIHSRGPLSAHLEKIRCDPSSQLEDTICTFLREGILVPVIRQPSPKRSVCTVEENWAKGTAGVHPGEFIALNREEGRDLLPFVDGITGAYAELPKHVGTSDETPYAQLLHDFLVKEGPYCLANLQPEHSGLDIQGEWRLCSHLFEEFTDEVRSNRTNPKFRRGKVENLAEKYIRMKDPSFRLRSYEDLIKRIPHGNPTTSIESAAYYLLNVSSTIYEAYHSRELQTVGGLFPLHEVRLIENGLYNHLVNLPPREEIRRSAPIQAASLNVNSLTARQIVEFRKRDEFQQYCSLLKQIKPVSPGNSFASHNRQYLEYLFQSHIPLITRQYPHAAAIARTMSGTGEFVTALGVIGEAYGDLILVGIRAVATVMTVVGSSVMATAKPVSSVARWIQRKFAQRRFRLNNYADWNETSHVT
jgi:hypothetical protein